MNEEQKICRTCKHFSYTTIGMKTGACWKGGTMIDSEAFNTICNYAVHRVPSDEFFCAAWEPENE